MTEEVDVGQAYLQVLWLSCKSPFAMHSTYILPLLKYVASRTAQHNTSFSSWPPSWLEVVWKWFTFPILENTIQSLHHLY